MLLGKEGGLPAAPAIRRTEHHGSKNHEQKLLQTGNAVSNGKHIVRQGRKEQQVWLTIIAGEPRHGPPLQPLSASLDLFPSRQTNRDSIYILGQKTTW